ncbi:hypothetical protein CHUAL_004781 [Chamberlinius hualienensis]
MSFLTKMEKMKGTTLEEAIQQKYLYEEEDDSKESCLIFAPRRSDQLLPSTVVINNCTIEKLGNFQRVHQLLSGIRELDLAQNQILDLQEVLKLLESITRLSFLNLSCNNLSSLAEIPNNLPCYSTLKRLVLNNTFIKWSVIKQFLVKLVNLEELYLCLNDFREVNVDTEVSFPSMKLVHLSGNPLSEWEELMKVGIAFPNLESLVIVDCEIATIVHEDMLDKVFSKLSLLNVNNNKIKNWEEIDKFRLFPALNDARVLGLPIYEEYTEHERRQLLISRLPNISRLNGSLVSDSEREDAERAFLRHYMNQEIKPSRYDELEAKHGRLDPLVEVDLAPQLVVTVVIHCGDRKTMRSLNLRMSLSEFKHSLHRFTGLPPNKMRVFYLDKGMGYVPEEMKFNAKKLYSYCVADGDEFIVDEKR